MTADRPRKTIDVLVERMTYAGDRASDAAARELADRLAETVESAVDRVAESESSSGPTPLLDLQGVADYLNVSPRFVEGLVSSGELVPIRIRSVRRFSVDAVDAYLRSCARPRRK